MKICTAFKIDLYNDIKFKNMKMDYEEAPLSSDEYFNKLKTMGSLKAEKLNFDKYVNKDSLSNLKLNENSLKLTPFDWIDTQDEKYLWMPGVLTPSSMSNGNTLKSTILTNELNNQTANN